MSSSIEEIAKQEERVICRALRDSNNPKIVKEDMAIFSGLIEDLFPGVKIDRLVDAQFEKLIAQSCKDRGLQPEPSFIIKVVQFEELLQIRHSVFILGFAAVGKTSVWKILGDTYKKQNKKFVHHVINPKAVTTKELYGYISQATREWKDGILSTIMRNLAEMQDTPQMPKFFVLDGDIDALWIESMNTVMDDNKILTLASNERIPLRPSMRMIFEVGSLKYASPATVSRAGIIYVNVADVGWPFYFQSWIERLESSLERSTITVFQQKYVQPCLEEINRNYKTIVPINDMTIVQTITRLMSSLLNDYNKSNAAKVNLAAQQMNQQAQQAGQSNQQPDYSKDVIEYLFIFSLIWSVGGVLYKDQLNNDFRKNFSKFWRPAFPKGVVFPAQGDIFDYFVDINQETGQPDWKPWSDMVRPYEHDPDVPVSSIHVQTIDSYRIHYLMDHLLKNGHPVLLAGAAGLGKSVLLKSKLKSLNDQMYQYATVSMNYYTTSAQLQMVLETYIEKKVGNKFAPLGTRKLIYMIDDLNMSQVDQYGTQQPIALLRQHIDYGFWYDRDKLITKEVGNVQFVASMNPYAGSFEIDPQYQWHYSPFAVDMPSEENLLQIYGSILNAHMTRENSTFKKDVQQCASAIIKTLLKVHNKIAMEFLPTSIKFHYQFNLRDLTNIVAGIMKMKAEQFKEGPVTFVQIMMHECDRVYCDRMCDQADKDRYQKLITDIVKQELATVVINEPNRPKSGTGVQIAINMEQVFQPESNYFTNFSLGIGEGSYAPLQSYQRMNQLLNEALVSHNESNAEMNLVLFQDAMQHICRISRIIRTSDALLVGVGGSGKQSLAKLAAFINDYEVFSIVISSTYGVADFKADLRKLFRKAGEKEIPTMFLFTDQQITNEEFLVYINDLLSSGFIAGLWPAEEEEEVINNMRNRVKDAGLPETKESIMNFFVQKVKENLHVVLGFSPNGDAFRVRCRKFPSLVNCTTIDWFMPWPYEALESVALNFISNRERTKDKQFDDVHIELTEAQCRSIAKFMAHANELVTNLTDKYRKLEKRNAYTTPKSFLELISLYLRQLYVRTQEIQNQINRLENGNATLIKTEQDVGELKKRLEDQRIEVKKQEEQVASMIGGITEERNKVGAKAADAEVEKQKTAAVEAEVNAAAQAAEAELLKAKPIQEEAERALNTLNKDNLTELKSFANPSAEVVKVMEAVIILLNKPGQVPKDLSWKAAKGLMGNVDKFLATLQNFDKENIHPTNKAAVLKYTSQETFNGEFVKSKSQAAAGICDWCRNIIKFHDVFLFVEPLRQKTEDLKGQLEVAQKKLRTVEAQVNALNESLNKLEIEFKAAEDKRDAVIAQAKDMENRLELANRLVNGLASEKIRWKQSVETLKSRNKTLVGDVLVIAAFISYSGAFSRNYRSEMLKGWMDLIQEFDIPIQKDFDPLSLLTDPAIVAQWNNDKLPTDRFSLENASIFTNCDRWPLIIDPQLQGMEWIKTREAKNNLKVIRLNQKDWLNVVKDAVENGYPVLVENISESIDAVLNPILGREIINKGKPTQAIRIGDKEISYHNDFKIFFQTKYPNPHYSPEIQAQTTLINFTVTEEGLEDQLLADVVLEERPDLEDQKTKLMRQQNEFAITLQQLEADLLERLSKAGDNIIEDIGLITNLEKTKATANEIAQKVIEARQTEIDINKAREQYRAVASRSSMLYFLLNSLSVIDHFYQFSLAAFKIVFFRAIRSSEKSEDVQTRVGILLDAITTAIHQYTTRGLFERHKLIFNSQLCFNILKKAGQLPSNEFQFLLRGTQAIGRDNTLGDFISNSSWACILALAQNIPDVFAKLPDDIEGSAKRWKEWVQHESPEKEKLPQDWKSKTPLQQLCIIRALRPDRLLTAMTQFIANSIDPKYVEAVPFNYPEVFETSSRTEPIFFILSPGVDPVKDVEVLGKQLGFSFDNGLFKSVSLGQGQEKNAERFVEEMSQKGGWILLQNIHLMKNWQVRLEKLMDQVCQAQSHENFRLMISAEPAADPTVASVLPGIVQMCIKVTNEPPTGIKANMNRAMALFNNDVFESCSKANEFKSVLFALNFFHAILLERRKFGSIGWNTPYNFTNGDLTICKDVLFNYLEANVKVPWDDLKYMFTDIFYGGHIGDDLDRRFIKAYANEIFSDALFEDGKLLAPDFYAPPPMTYDGYKQYLNENLPPDNPKMFGLHPNAEITYLTSQSNALFLLLQQMQPADVIAGGEGGDEKDFKDKIEELIQMIPEAYNVQDLMERNPDAQPYNCVCIQECARMNILTSTMRQTLTDVKLGLNGELTISEQMEKVIDAVRLDVVPAAWNAVAYPSLKGLAPWLKDLEQRAKQLSDWSAEMGLPKYVWLSGLFNPQSFLRAVIQTTARANQWPLDMMALNVEITKKELSDITSAPREGAYVQGLFMEGARWDKKSNSIRDAVLKDLYPPLPPVFLKAVTVDKIEAKDTYECPMYKIKNRNRLTYVWTFNIKTREPPSKWILAGVALLLANDL